MILVDNLGHCMLFGCENGRFSRLGDSGVNDSALTLLIDSVESRLEISIRVRYILFYENITLWRI